MKPTSKRVLLKQFTAIIWKHDPMGTKSQMSDEYEPEALSILSRFCEGAIHVAEEEKAVIDYATAVVTQTFVFWFDRVPANLEPMTMELIKAYIDAFPRADTIEQLTSG